MKKIVSNLCVFSFIAFLVYPAAWAWFGVVSLYPKLFSDMFGILFLITAVVLMCMNKDNVNVEHKAKSGIALLIIMVGIVAILGFTKDVRDIVAGPKTVVTDVYECEMRHRRATLSDHYYIHLNQSYRGLSISSADYKRLCVARNTIKVTYYENNFQAEKIEILPEHAMTD